VAELIEKYAVGKSCLTLRETLNTIDYMIKTFRNQESKQIFERVGPYDMAPGVLRAAQRKLAMLDASDSRGDLHSAPGSNPNRVPGRKSRQSGQYFEGRWWLRFRWDEGDIYGVEITHYTLGAAA
jgi:proteic killer suppression protein